MKFSVWPNPARPTAEILDLARFADAEGWYGMWFADHYMPNTGSEAIEPGDVHECWAILPAIAAVTERIRLGSLVAPTSVHHPAVLANRAATIDHVSNGRMVLGIGAGWQINEHKAYGIDLEEPGPRVSRFEEAIQVVRSLLDNERTDFHGAFYDITDAPADPKPVQSPLPILVGTGSPRMLRITARHADEWNTWGAPDMAGGALAKLLAACEQVDRDPATMWKSAQALVFMSDNVELAENIRAGDMGERSIIGSTEQLVDEIGRYAELGFDEFIVPDFTLGASAQERADRYASLRSDILSQLDET
jgi:probable F420-dependent oxidoreductase